MNERQCIGVVGGLGPYAGLDLVRKIFDRTRADHDQDHLPVMLYSFPGDIPVRPEFLLGLTRENPGEAIGDIMARMAEAGATIIGMPCNTAHSPRILDAHAYRTPSATESTASRLHPIPSRRKPAISCVRPLAAWRKRASRPFCSAAPKFPSLSPNPACSAYLWWMPPAYSPRH